MVGLQANAAIAELRRDSKLFLWAGANDKQRAKPGEFAKRSPFNLVCYEQLCKLSGWKQSAEWSSFVEASTHKILGSQLVEGSIDRKTAHGTRTGGARWRQPSLP